jgi:hypothetical protein
MKPVIPLFSKIPYVGGFIKVFYQGFSRMISFPVKRIRDKAKGIKKRLRKRKLRKKIKKCKRSSLLFNVDWDNSKKPML